MIQMKVKTEEGNFNFEGEYSYSEAEAEAPLARWYLFLRNHKTDESLGLTFFIEDVDELDNLLEGLQQIRESFKK